MPQDTISYIWAPIQKSDNASRTVIAPITGPNNLDLDQQIVDLDFIRQAVGPWMRFGNVRQAHDSKKPIGKTIAIDLNTEDRVPVATMRISDDAAWKLVQDEVLSGVSVGIKNARIVQDENAPRGRIVGGNLVEISLVDHPANPHAKLTIIKSADNDDQDFIDCQSGEHLMQDPDVGKSGDRFLTDPTPVHHKPPVKRGSHTHDGGVPHSHSYLYENHMHCTTCGADDTICPHSDSTKAADSFKVDFGIHPPTPSHELSPAAPSKPDHSNSSMDPSEALVRLQYKLSTVARAVSSIASDLKTATDSRFNPNTKPAAPEGRMLDVGQTPESMFDWEGQLAHDALPGKSAELDADTVDAIEKSIHASLSFLYEEDFIGKSAEPDSIKAAFIRSVSQVAAQAAKEATAAYDERFARIESLAAPAKGWRSEVVEKQFANSRPQASDTPVEKLERIAGAIREHGNTAQQTEGAATLIAAEIAQRGR